MNTRLFLAFTITTLLFACSGNNENDILVEQQEKINDTLVDTYEERLARIEKYTALLYEDSFSFNPQHANALLMAYEDHIKHHSFNNATKDIMFKAGELSRALNQPHKAIRYFNLLIEDHPTHPKSPVALFYKAMIIGDILQEHELAKKTYMEFLDKYPNHDLAESAKASIELVGKPLEEIIETFEKKNAKPS